MHLFILIFDRYIINQKIIFVIMKNIIENIRTLRESKGYSQEYMAEMMGITQSSYARFERGATKTDLKIVALIANTLKMNFIDVITYPEKYINVKDASKEMAIIEPEIILQIKVRGAKREQILKTTFGDNELDFLS